MELGLGLRGCWGSWGGCLLLFWGWRRRSRGWGKGGRKEGGVVGWERGLCCLLYLFCWYLVWEGGLGGRRSGSLWKNRGLSCLGSWCWICLGLGRDWVGCWLGWLYDSYLLLVVLRLEIFYINYKMCGFFYGSI